MNSKLIWIVLLVTRFAYVTPSPVKGIGADAHDTGQRLPHDAFDSHYESSPKSDNEQVISVRITSSVAVGRGKGKSTQMTNESDKPSTEFVSPPVTTTTETYKNYESRQQQNPDIPPNLEGANIEFIKQLNAKKEARGSKLENHHPFQLNMHHRYIESNYTDEKNDYETNNDKEYDSEENTALSTNMPSLDEHDHNDSDKSVSSSILDEALKYSNERLATNTTDDIFTKAESKQVSEVINNTTSTSDVAEINPDHKDFNETDDSIAEPSIKSVLEIANNNSDNYENIENVPFARSVQSPSSKNYIHDLIYKTPNERESSTILTTVSFNVVHDTPRVHYNDHSTMYDPSRTFMQQQKFYQPPTIYSQPSQVYSEPAKIYSEPAKIYSQPAKVYSEPSKIYSEPSKIYSEPAKFYSEPASLHLNEDVPQSYSPWQQRSHPPSSTTTFGTTPSTTITLHDLTNTPSSVHQAEKNYEVDEKVSVLTDGRSHGVQETTTEKCKQDNCKVGYVVKGRQYNKYRVEERTSDGFIVGEYGVVRNEDGALRGVRYTADSDASPRLIYDALMKFLQLK